MKTRHGFVSNSSTSTFVCLLCGTAESGMDVGASELGFQECEHFHTFCKSEARITIDEMTETEEDEGDLPERFCPVCQLDVVVAADLKAYLMKTTGTTEEEVLAAIHTQNPQRLMAYDQEIIAVALRRAGLDLMAAIEAIREEFNSLSELHEFLNP